MIEKVENICGQLGAMSKVKKGNKVPDISSLKQKACLCVYAGTRVYFVCNVAVLVWMHASRVCMRAYA